MEEVEEDVIHKESQGGKPAWAGNSGGEKSMHPEPLYKYHLRREADDGKRMESE